MPFHPVRIGIFGSVVRGENTENSDIDILYQLKEVVGLYAPHTREIFSTKQCKTDGLQNTPIE
jgi:predicted nucleotidyltransferase